MESTNIIDADGHVHERDSDVRAFMDEPCRGRKGSLLPNYEWNGTMYDKLGKETHDVPTRLRDMS